MAGVGVDLAMILLLAAVIALAAAGTWRLVPRVAPPARSARLGPLGRAVVMAAAATVALAALAALAVSVRTNWIPDYDAFSFWLPRANIIAYHDSIWLGNDGWGSLDHPEYPPLAPTMYAVAFDFAGGRYPALLSFEQTLLGLAFVAAALALLDRCTPRWLSFPSLALLLVAPGFFRRLESLLPDQTLAYLVALGALACMLWLHERRGAWLALAVGLLAAASLTKSEGVTYTFLLALIVAGGAALRRDWRTTRPALALLLAVVAIEPWRIWLADNGLPTSDTDYHLSDLLQPGYLADHAGRLPPALDGVIDALFRASSWFVLLPLVLFALVAIARRAPLHAAASATWLVLATLGLVSVYWIGQFVPNSEADELHTSAYRVSATIVIVAASVLPLMLGIALDGEPASRPRSSSRAEPQRDAPGTVGAPPRS